MKKHPKTHTTKTTPKKYLHHIYSLLRTYFMKKQKGFTLIELMVVMAIIAILATAGLSAYTGYIKKARDTTRITDVQAMKTIALAALSENGSFPRPTAFRAAVMEANNGNLVEDPLNGVTACQHYVDPTWYPNAATCAYTYATCDNRSHFVITAYLETENQAKELYTLPGNYVVGGPCTAVDGLGPDLSCTEDDDCASGYCISGTCT